MQFIPLFFSNIIDILLEMAPWLLFGALVSGVLHTLLPIGFIKKHLGKPGLYGILKAVAIGIPMPLCSCAVIPAALGLKKEGATTGATTGFLISTPQTGVDSIMVAITFFGLPFAIFKVLAALISGLVGGIWIDSAKESNTSAKAIDTSVKPCCQSKAKPIEVKPTTKSCCGSKNKTKDIGTRNTPAFIKESTTYAFITLFKDIYLWLTIGVIVSAIITTAVPQDTLASQWWASGIWGLFLTLLISIPLYVCATASMPLAASLVVAGLSPGAALVFLMAGPVTNVATIGTIYKNFGKRVAGIYLLTVITMSLLAGYLFNTFLTSVAPTAPIAHHDHNSPLAYGAMIILIGLIGYHFLISLQAKLTTNKPTKSCCSS